MTTRAITALDVAAPDKVAHWPTDDRALLADLLRRRAELMGLPEPAAPWPTSDNDHMLRMIAPNYATAPLAPHHHDFWNHCRRIVPGVRPDPFVGLWARGGAKTSSVQLATAMLGALHRRRFCLFVTRTQDKANEKVEDLANIFTAPEFAARWPKMARKRTFTVTSAQRGARRREGEWSRTRVRTAAGFSVEGVGLDTAVRGVKLEDQRPDWIVFDDIDDHDDNPGKVLRLLDAIRRAIIPAGSPDVGFVFINNLVHDNSVASHLAYPERFPEEERLLLNRRLSGPVPAVRDLEVVAVDNSGNGQPGWRIVGGTPSWVGFGVDAAQAALNATNLRDFEAEYQHDTEVRGGVFDHVVFKHCAIDEVPWGRLVTTECWVDPATSDTDRSDSMGISVAGIADDGVVYVFYTWEKVTTPTDALREAILRAREYGASVLGIETDNGGDAWAPVYREALRELVEEGAVPADWTIGLDSARAGQTGKTKVERIKQLVAPLEHHRIVLVRGGAGHPDTSAVLEAAIRRFPKKPLDGIDAFWWAWSKLVADVGRARPTMKHRAGTQRPQWKPRPRR